MPRNPKVLISGAGIAGLTLAYWLRRHGFEPSVVERRPDLDDRGYMIDFYGSGFDVAERMGLRDALAARHYPVETLEFVDDDGDRKGSFDIEKLRALLDYRHFNFMRGDLADVLFDAVRDDVPVRFATHVAAFTDGPDGVAVTLSDGTEETVDLLVGADGFHSATRALAWGDETQFERFLGYYIACGIVGDGLGAQGRFLSHLEPGRQASVYPIRGGRLATFFAFKSDRLDAPTREAQGAVLDVVFGGAGWEVPALVAATKASPEFYFDAVSQIELAPWHRGRVALVGDACQCLTLLAGQGASMAMAGAYFLAQALHREDGAYAPAFAAYQARMLPEVTRRQARARKLARSFVPESRLGIWLAYGFLRLAFLPGLRAVFRKQVGAGSLLK